MTAKANGLTLKVILKDSKPPIWRRLLMPQTGTLSQLHLAIQAVMN